MSEKKPRSPQEKKALSYAKDRRNTYGENDKASRKLIPLRKAMENRQDRRKVAQEVATLSSLDEASADLLESSVRHDVHRVGGWRKGADQPLGKIVTWAKEARENRAQRKSRMQSRQAEREDPSALRKLANSYRRMARRFARNLRIGKKAGVPGELERIWLEQAQAFEDQADEIVRQRERSSD
jgi:hypothetical protein